jgi:hypothetical protein
MSLSLVESLEDAVTLQSFVAEDSDRAAAAAAAAEVDPETLAMSANDRLNTEDPALATVAAAVVLDQEPPEWARRQLKVGSDDQGGDQ